MEISDVMKDLQVDQQMIYKSLRDVLGSDLDTSLMRTPQLQFFGNDQQNISSGSQLSMDGNAQTITIRPQISGILNLKSLAHVCKIAYANEKTNSINNLSLFRPVSVKIGNVTVSYSNGQMMCQQNLELCSDSLIRAYWIGLGMSDESQMDYNLLYSLVTQQTAITASAEAYSYETINDPTSVTTSTTTATAGYMAAMNSYLYGKCSSGDKYSVVPLFLIFPKLIESLGEQIYCPYHGFIEFQFQTVPFVQNSFNMLEKATATINSYTALIPGATYQIYNQYVYYQYHTLADSPSVVDRLKQSIIEYNPIYPLQDAKSLSNIVNLSFSVNQKQKIHQLMFACHPKSSALKLATAITNSSSLYGSNVYAGECIMFPAFKIKQITYNVNGSQWITLCDQVAALQLVQGSQTCQFNYPYYEGRYAKSQTWNFLRSPYTFDLTRFKFDERGSSTGQPTVVNIQIEFDFSEDLSIYGRNITVATNTGKNSINGGTAPANYDVYAYLFVSQQAEMKNANMRYV